MCNFRFLYILIIILLLLAYYQSNQSTITNYDVVYGRPSKGIEMANKMEYPTVNVDLFSKVNCGAYLAQSKYGECNVMVDYTQKIAEVHFFNKPKNFTIDYNQNLKLTNLKKYLIHIRECWGTYYRGC